MAHIKLLKLRTVLFTLMLFLQTATICSRKLEQEQGSLSNKSILPLPKKLSSKELLLGNQIEDQKKQNIGYNPDEYSSFYNQLDFDPYYEPVYKCYSNKNTDYDSGYESDSQFQPIKKFSPISPESTTKNKSRKFNFKEQILSMRKIADLKRGIIPNVSGNRFTRVLEDDTTNNNLSPSEDFIIIILNRYRAAIKICELYQEDSSFFENKVNEFYLWFRDLLDKSVDFWIQKIKEVNRAIVLQLQERVFNNKNLNEINNNLSLAESYVGLDDTHYDVNTILKIGDKKIELEDKQYFTLTDKQKNEYRNRASKDWYIYLDRFEKMLLDAYVDKFLDDKHYIPTQLRKIPGCRNAYKKDLWGYDANNNKINLSGYYHSGSIASPIQPKTQKARDVDLEITKDNWEQIQKKDKSVETISLNYNMNMPVFEQVREKKIVENTKEVVGDDKFMNLSINGIGTSYNVSNQYNKLIQQSIRLYKNKYPDLCSSFTNNRKNKTLFQRCKDIFNKKSIEETNKQIEYRNIQIEKINDPRDKSFFKRLQTLEESSTTSTMLHNLKQTAYINDNPNATACANYIALKTSLKRADQSTSSVLFNCKSGKDRTGLMSYYVDANIIKMNYPELDIENSLVYEKLARSGHYQFLASINGGMPGRFGMKDVKCNAYSRPFTQQLFPKTATLTHIDLIKQQVEALE